MPSRVQIYNVSQEFCRADQHTVRDIGHRGNTNPRSLAAGFLSTTVPHILNYVGKTVCNSCNAQDGYCSRGITATSKYLQSMISNGIIIIMPSVGIKGNIALSLLTYVSTRIIYNSCTDQDGYCSRAITPIGNAITESRQNGWLKPVVDDVTANPTIGAGARSIHSLIGAGLLSTAVPHVLNSVGKTMYNSCNAQDGYCNHVITDIEYYVKSNPITTVASAIAGIAGSVFGPLYSQTAITHAGVLAFNEMMIATINHAAQNGAVTPLVTQAALVAANNARYTTVLRQNLGTSLVSGLGAAIVPHVLNYIGKTISNSCTAQDGYCSQGITEISKIRIGS